MVGLQTATQWTVPVNVKQIVSGGQTGVDRAALDVAIELGIPHGGWCPRDRLAEDGPIDAKYELTETKSSEYPVRTEQNVIDSDATLLLYIDKLYGGSRLTYRFALAHERPCLRVDLLTAPDPTAVRMWLADNEIVTLNVAGPRASSSPDIYARAIDFLRAALSD